MRILSVITIVLSVFAQAGCQDLTQPTTDQGGAPETAVARIQPAKSAATQPSNTNVSGSVTFVQKGDDAMVTAELTGLSEGKHGFHIHEKGDLSDPALNSAGPHYNPGGHKHGGLDDATRHAGDLGNLTADSSGNATYRETIKGLKIADLIGRSVLIHAREDDLKSDPSGNSGGRVAGGVIEKK